MKTKNNMYFLLILFFIFSTANLYPQVKGKGVTPAFSYERCEYLKTTMLTVPDGGAVPCVVDWDGNGTKDIITGTGKGTIILYRNSEQGGQKFSEGEYVTSKGYRIYYSHYPTPFINNDTDINNDGKKDLFVESEGYVYIYTNTGADTSPEFNSDPLKCKFGTNAKGEVVDEMGLDDLNETDIITNNPSYVYQGGWAVFKWGSTPAIVVAYTIKTDSSTGKGCMKIGIYTNKGGITNWSQLLNVKVGGNDIELDVGYRPSVKRPYVGSVFPVDWDGDNVIDLIVAYSTNSFERYENTTAKDKVKVLFYKGIANKNPNFNSPVELKFTNNRSLNVGTSIFVTDWDDDGDLDILVGVMGTFRLIERIGNGNSDFKLPDSLEKRVFQGPITDLYAGSSPVVCDLNGDGIKDLLAGTGGGVIYKYINYGDNEHPLFKEGIQLQDKWGNNIINCNGSWIHPRIFDVNNDGKKDLLFTESNGGNELIVYTNIGDNSNFIFDKPSKIVTKSGNPIGGGEPFIFDLNNDGFLDVISGSGGTITVYYGLTNTLIGSNVEEGVYFEEGTMGKRLNLGSMGDNPFILDWNNDNIYDVITAAENKLVWAEGIGFYTNPLGKQVPYFNPKQDVTIKGSAIALGEHAKAYIIDFNGDGWYDIINGNTSYYIRVFWGSTPRYVSEDDIILPEKSIYAYPNPIRNGSTINFRFLVRDDSIVEIKIYTVSGKLIDEIKTSGAFDKENIYSYDVSHLNNGVYYYKIKATSIVNGESKEYIKKFVILK